MEKVIPDLHYYLSGNGWKSFWRKGKGGKL
jgi:hypothetical protein